MTTKRPIALIFVLFMLFVSACSAANPAPTSPKVYKVGILGFAGDQPNSFDGLKAGLAQLGFVEGQTIEYIHEVPKSPDKAADAAKALLSQNVDVLYGWGRIEGLTLKSVTTQVPIVVGGSYLPVEFGVVPSLEHPGGNVTGAFIPNSVDRRLELLLQMDSNIHTVLVPYNTTDKLASAMVTLLNEVAPKLKVTLVISNMTDAASAATVVENAPSTVDALFLLPDRLTLSTYPVWLKQAASRNIPVSTFVGLFQTNDYLMGYGPDTTSQSVQAAHQISQILKGSNPGDLPVEPVDLYLAVNLDVAQRLNITVPDSILQQAKVIVRPNTATASR